MTNLVRKPSTYTQKTSVAHLSDISEKIGALINGVENLNKKHDDAEARNNARHEKQDEKIEKLISDFTDMKMTWNKIGGGIFMLGAVFSFIGYTIHLLIDYLKH